MELSEPQPVDMSGAVACPGGTESSVTGSGRDVQVHVGEVPYGVSVVTAKIPVQALKTEAAQMALFVKATMSDMPVGCPHPRPRIWKAKIA